MHSNIPIEFIIILIYFVFEFIFDLKMGINKENLNKVIICNQSVGIIRYIGPISEESGF